jgi:hypothetical protein
MNSSWKKSNGDTLTNSKIHVTCLEMKLNATDAQASSFKLSGLLAQLILNK